MTVAVGCIGQSNRFIHRYKISQLGHTVWMNFRPLTIQATFIYLFAVTSIPQITTRTRFEQQWMPKNDTSEILLVDQPGNDKLCCIRTLLDAVSKVKFTYYSKTCVRQPPLKLTLAVDVERRLSYNGYMLAKLHDMYLYKTDNFFHINHYLKSVSKVALLHRFYCMAQSAYK